MAADDGLIVLLIRYAHPRFVRLLRGTTPIETTQTFKPKKAALQAAGFDPRLTGGDDLFVRDAAARSSPSAPPHASAHHDAPLHFPTGARRGGKIVCAAVRHGARGAGERRAPRARLTPPGRKAPGRFSKIGTSWVRVRGLGTMACAISTYGSPHANSYHPPGAAAAAPLDHDQHHLRPE